MAYANPYYRPDWQDVHDARKAIHTETARGAEKLREQMGELFKAGRGYGDAEYDALQARWQIQSDLASEQRGHTLETFKMQFPTVEEHARWYYDMASYGRERADREGIPYRDKIDFSSFKTIEEAVTALNALDEEAENNASLSRNRLPTGQPENIMAFGKDGEVLSTWRTFSPKEMFPQLSHGVLTPSVHALMTVQERDGHYHVAFMTDMKKGGESATNAIQDLATVVYHQAVHLAKNQEPTQQALTHGSTLSDRARQAAEPKAIPHVSDFTFYVHVPASEGSWGKERFSRVDMVFEKGRFGNPQWHHFDAVPKNIQDAADKLLQQAPAPEAPLLIGNTSSL